LTNFAAARDAVGEEPIAAGGVQKLFRSGVPERPTVSGRPEAGTELRTWHRIEHEIFTAARDAVGEEPIGMGGW
jgi:hypothetical protein